MSCFEPGSAGPPDAAEGRIDEPPLCVSRIVGAREAGVATNKDWDAELSKMTNDFQRIAVLTTENHDAGLVRSHAVHPMRESRPLGKHHRAVATHEYPAVNAVPHGAEDDLKE